VIINVVKIAYTTSPQPFRARRWSLLDDDAQLIEKKRMKTVQLPLPLRLQSDVVLKSVESMSNASTHASVPPIASTLMREIGS
jgi:hypothetical protein